jgi:hypothetical protein
LAVVFKQVEYIAMNGLMDAEGQEVDEQEGQAITVIREALSGTILRVSQYVDNGLFSDIDAFVKLSEGNTSITKVRFYPFEKKGDDELWKKIGKGLANLKSLEHFIVKIALSNENSEEETNAGEPMHRADFGILSHVLPYLRQIFSVMISTPSVMRQREVHALAHLTIKEFDRGCDFPVDTLHLILSALATLPSLEVAILGNDLSENSHLKLPEAMKNLMLSPSLREVYFEEFTFSRRLCLALGDALQGGSNVALLRFETCSFPEGASHRVARALKQNTTLTTFILSGIFSQAFYDAFAAALLINTTLTDLELEIPDDEAEAALMTPVFLALGMNKGLKKLTINEYSSSVDVDGQVYLALRDGLEKNSTVEMLHISICRFEDFADSLLPCILPFLRVSTTLKALKVMFGYVLDPSDPHHVATSCLAIVAFLRENSSLETLEMHCHRGGMAPGTFMTALESVQMNTTLKELHISPMIASFGKAEMNRVVSLVKKNYALIKLGEDFIAHDETGELGTILRLNQAGRRYLLDDAGSIAKGVEVLIDVRDDLGCLFYHLLENPVLCEIEHKYEQPDIPTSNEGSHGTKRARLAH